MYTLEHEFAMAVELHKYNMINLALAIFEDKGIYEEDIMGDYRYSYLSGVDRANEVSMDLLKRAKKEEEQDLYDQIYEMCWKKISRIPRGELMFVYEYQTETQSSNQIKE